MQKIKDLAAGEVFTYGKFEWLKLDDLKDGVLAITKDILPDTRKFDEEINNWKNSELRDWLNNNFLNALVDNGAKEKDFLEFKRDLTADDGTRDYGTCVDRLSLISCEEYRKYRGYLEAIGNWWWTLTPYSCLEKYSYYVRIVYTDGSLNWLVAYNGYNGVRPLCFLNSEILVSKIEEEEKKESITEKIRRWFKDRNLDTADPKRQMLKLIEEAGELAEGLAKDRPDQVKDSIGDIYVVLTGLALQLGLDIEDCIELAYNEIKNRKGKMVDGVFVKEEDLENV